ncbi:MAG TPA: hypothetical protein VN035_11480 [Microbacterium sp.]|nr:hypothetical protein [Microbacterium sp.]
MTAFRSARPTIATESSTDRVEHAIGGVPREQSARCTPTPGGVFTLHLIDFASDVRQADLLTSSLQVQTMVALLA